MKRVSFKVAKAIKEAGYPQGIENTAYYNEDGVLVKPFVFNGGNEIADAPTYIDVWLWLWENGISIRIEKDDYTFDDEYCTAWGKDAEILYQKYYDKSVENPEKAISEAINYLVDNDLIKIRQ